MRNFKYGYTLIEAMIVVTILGIILAAGIPYYGSLTNDADVEEQSREMISLFNSARQRAIKDGVPVYIYPDSLDDDWNNDWVRYANTEIREVEFNQNIVVTNESNISALMFDPRGRLYNGVNATVLNNASFLFCYNGNSDIVGRRVVINFLGRITTDLVDEC